MNRISLVDDFDLRSRMAKDKHWGGYPFVTISRQAGAGGHTLAEAVTAGTDRESYKDIFMGWKIMDRELCEEVVRSQEFHTSMKSLLAEEYHSELEEFVKALVGQGDQYAMYKKMFWMIKSLARVGKIIFIGRAGNCVTAGQPGGIHVRLVAPLSVRTERMMKLFGVDERKAGKMIERQDRDRARLVKTYFDKDVDDPAIYDAVSDTGEMSIDELADKTIEMIQQKAREIGYA
jgi:cytidylate kinase